MCVCVCVCVCGVCVVCVCVESELNANGTIFEENNVSFIIHFSPIKCIFTLNDFTVLVIVKPNIWLSFRKMEFV